MTYDDEVRLSFQNNGPYDSVEVFRDCTRIAVLAGDAAAHVDRDAGPGIRQYAVRGVRGGVASDLARSSLRVGVGAVLQQGITWPALYPQQLARDPVDGSFYVVGSYPGDERNIHHFDRNFEYVDTREALADPEWQVATHAVRRRPGEPGELWYVTWKQPVPLGGVSSQRFLLVTETLAGSLVGQVEMTSSVPTPTNGFIRYPTGLAWDPEKDTFLFLERNSRTFVEMATDGSKVREFTHPDPPFQNFVFALGVSIVPERGTFFYTTALRHDHQVTLVREMTFAGVPTGVEIPLDGVPHDVTGISVSGPDLIAVGTYRFPEILRIKAFPELPTPFIRGDSDGSGTVNLTDVIVTLEYLFRSGPRPACEDGADADDSSSLNLTDPVVTLQALFLGAKPLAAPYPAPGQDPTPDGLRCGA
jgi:hypothetical protein